MLAARATVGIRRGLPAAFSGSCVRVYRVSPSTVKTALSAAQPGLRPAACLKPKAAAALTKGAALLQHRQGGPRVEGGLRCSRSGAGSRPVRHLSCCGSRQGRTTLLSGHRAGRLRTGRAGQDRGRAASDRLGLELHSWVPVAADMFRLASECGLQDSLARGAKQADQARGLSSVALRVDTALSDLGGMLHVSSRGAAIRSFHSLPVHALGACRRALLRTDRASLTGPCPAACTAQRQLAVLPGKLAAGRPLGWAPGRQGRRAASGTQASCARLPAVRACGQQQSLSLHEPQMAGASQNGASNGAASNGAVDKEYDYDLFTIGAGSGGVRGTRFAAQNYGTQLGPCAHAHDAAARQA